MPQLLANAYGKHRVRLVKVCRGPDGTDFYEWTVRILFEGDYAAAFTEGDNSAVLPTDTMKNTVYSLARASHATAPEQFAMELTAHFLDTNSELARVFIEISAKPWEHLTVGGGIYPEAFRLSGTERDLAIVTATPKTTELKSGLTGLIVMKTAHSGFEGFKKDALTTLRETGDRLLGTDATVEWTYNSTALPFTVLRHRIKDVLLASFADHKSKSVQHTLYAMGEAVLADVPEVTAIKLTLPNIHCLLVDLSPFGQDNPNQIFVPVDEPHGYIEAQLTRDA